VGLERDDDPLGLDPAVHAIAGLEAQRRTVGIDLDAEREDDTGFCKIEQLDLDQLENVIRPAILTP
jgi:hypothetical protein